MPLDARTTSLDPASALSPASIINASTGDDLVGGLVPMVGAHHEQDLLATVAHPPDRRHDIRNVRVPPPAPARGVRRSRAPWRAGSGRARRATAYAKRTRPVRRARAQNRRVVSRSPGSVIRDVEMLRPIHRLEPRPVGPAAVQQQSVSVRVLHVGGARRGIEPARRPAVPAQPLAQGGPAQGAPPSPGEASRGNSGGPTGTGTRPSPSSRAMTLPCSPWEAGKAPGGQRCGVHPGSQRGRPIRWSGYHRALAASRYRLGVNASADQIAAQSIDHDEDRATLSRHGLPSHDGRLGRSRCSSAVVRSARLCQIQRSSSEIDTPGSMDRATDSEFSGGAALDTPFLSDGRWTSRFRAFKSTSQTSGMPCRA